MSAHRADLAGLAVFGGLAAWTFAVATSPDPSQLVTAGAGYHLLSACMLLSAAKRCGGLPQVPASCLVSLAAALSLRLCSTTYFEGYLPVDATGDGPYQVLEGMTLLCVLRALTMFEAAGSSIDWAPTLAGLALAGGLGAACHGDLDKSPAFDALYAVSVYAEVAACAHCLRQAAGLPLCYVVPQLAGLGCRARFWVVAFPEISVEAPQLLQAFFPQVLVASHLVMCAAYGYAVMRDTFPESAAPQEAAVAPAPVEQHVTVGELKITVPAGCRQLVPVSAVYTDGLLRVVYQPTA